MAPALLEAFGVGPDSAATLLMTVGDNPQRLHSEAAFARLCGVAPIPTGSGKTDGYHRLHRGGDRQANSALWRIVLVRMSNDPTTKAYVERRHGGRRRHPDAAAAAHGLPRCRLDGRALAEPGPVAGWPVTPVLLTCGH